MSAIHTTTPVVRTLPGVQFSVIAPAGMTILAALHAAATSLLIRDVTITSGTDSHSFPDPHATGEAYDIETLSLSSLDLLGLLSYLEAALGPGFYCQYEVRPVDLEGLDPLVRRVAVVSLHATGPHLHVQRAYGTVYPPVHPAILSA